MKAVLPDILEKARINEADPHMQTHRGERFGRFLIPIFGKRTWLVCVASDGEGWEDLPPPIFEHVSVSVHEEQRTPTWEEMCFVKDLFWGPEECVVQYHPPKSDYVNIHQGCLHLWKVVGVEMPRPPKECL